MKIVKSLLKTWIISTKNKFCENSASKIPSNKIKVTIHNGLILENKMVLNGLNIAQNSIF